MADQGCMNGTSFLSSYGWSVLKFVVHTQSWIVPFKLLFGDRLSCLLPSCLQFFVVNRISAYYNRSNLEDECNAMKFKQLWNSKTRISVVENMIVWCICSCKSGYRLPAVNVANPELLKRLLFRIKYNVVLKDHKLLVYTSRSGFQFIGLVQYYCSYLY